MMTYQDACFAIEICRIVFAAVCGGLVLFAAKAVYMRLPAHWLCDFDEQPWEMHMPGFRGRKCRWFYAAFEVALMISFYRICTGSCESGTGFMIAAARLTAGGITAACAAVIALSDRDYMIVPDQLVIVMGICSIVMSLASSCGDAVFAGNLQACLRASFGEIIYGAFWGAALMLSVSAMGIITGKGSAAGFGDIKLMAVCGAVVGERVYIMYVLMVMMSGIYFSYCVVRGKVRSGEGLPLAPWICSAMLLCM